LREQTTEALEGEENEVRAKTCPVTTCKHDQAEELQQRNQDVVLSTKGERKS
jgi:hypothetical protein